MQNHTQNPAQPKKAYKAPTLTDCGTVEEFTETAPGGFGMDVSSS